MKAIDSEGIRKLIQDARRMGNEGTYEIVRQVLLDAGIPIKYAIVGGYAVKKRKGDFYETNMTFPGGAKLSEFTKNVLGSPKTKTVRERR